MALDTYANLKQAISDHLDRSDLDNYVDDFIDIAEARHKRELRFRDMLERDPLTVVNRFVDLPNDFLEAKTIRLLTDPVTVLTNVNLYEMNRVRSETNGKPTWFTIHETIEFDKTPNKAYSGEIVFYKELKPLSDSNTKNALLTKAPDVYLYSCLAAAAPFLMHMEMVQLWETLYANGRDALMKVDRKQSGPLISRVAGATP